MEAMEYKGGNLSDSVKHPALTDFAARMDGEPLRYIELHSGPGCYGNYPGSALQVMERWRSQGRRYYAWLNEEKKERREALASNTHGHTPHVRGDWKKHAGEYVQLGGPQALVLFDPCYVKDYDNETMALLAKLLANGTNVYLYAPMMKSVAAHKSRVEDIYKLIHTMGRSAAAIIHTAGNTGYFERDDHHIIVGKPQSMVRTLIDHSKRWQNGGLEYRLDYLPKGD